MSSDEPNLIQLLTDQMLPKPLLKSQAGLDHLDNLCRLMEQLSVLREQNAKLQTRVNYLETLQMSNNKDDVTPAVTQTSGEEGDVAQISTQGTKWGRMKTILTQTRKESTQRPPDSNDSGDASKWRRMKRALTRRSAQTSLQRSHSVPSSPTSAESSREVLVRTDAGEFRFQGLDDTFRQRLVEWEKKKGIKPRDSSLTFLEGISPQGTLERKLERNRSYSDSSVAGDNLPQDQDVAPRSTSEPQLPSKPQRMYKLMEEVKSKSEACRTLQRQVDAVDAEIDNVIEGQFQNLENYRKHVKKRGGRRIHKELSKVDEEMKNLRLAKERIRHDEKTEQESLEKLSIIDMSRLEEMCTNLCDQVKQLEAKVTDRSNLLQQLILSHWMSFELSNDKTEDKDNSPDEEKSSTDVKMGTNPQVRRLSDTSVQYETSKKLDFATAFSTAIYDDEALQMPKTEPLVDTSVSVTVKLPPTKQAPPAVSEITTVVTLPAPKTTTSRIEICHPSVPLPSRLEPAHKVKSMVAHFNQHGSPQPQQRPMPSDGVFKSSSFCSNQWSVSHGGVPKSASANAIYSDSGWIKYSNDSPTIYHSPRMSRAQPMSPRLSMRHQMIASAHPSLNGSYHSSDVSSPPLSPRTRTPASPRVARLKLRYAREEFLNREGPPIPNSPSAQWRNPQKKSIVEEEEEPKPEPVVNLRRQKVEENTSKISNQKISFFSFHLRRPKKQSAASHLCRQSLFVSLPTPIDVGAGRQSCPSSPAQQPKNQNKKNSWFMSSKLFKSK